MHRDLQMTLTLLAAATLGGIGGCVGPDGVGTLEARSLGEEPLALPGQYVAAFYLHNPDSETSFLLSDVPLESLIEGAMTPPTPHTPPTGQILHLELLWLPKPGATPMDRSATNVSIRYVIMSEGEIGLYGGAGFAAPRGKPGKRRLRMTLRDASLTLLDSSEGFRDVLGPTMLTGTFTAVHDPRRCRQLHYAISQIVTNALGRSRFVSAIRSQESGVRSQGSERSVEGPAVADARRMIGGS
jgi:hypothetical protein